MKRFSIVILLVAIMGGDHHKALFARCNLIPEIFDDNSLAFEITFSGTMFCYYFFFELLFGQTVGKMLTKTIVVDKNGNKPKAFNLIVRTIIRLFPFEWFTFLFGGFVLHDFLSKTTVIKRPKV